MKSYFFSLVLFLSLTSNLIAEESTVLDVYDDLSLDHNADGKPDLYYKNSKYSYTVFIDRNYDGEPDETYQYDNGTDFMIGGRLDDDLDHYFETQIVMLDNLEIYQLIDSNNDKMIDIVIELIDGVIVAAKKYKFSSKPMVINVEYEFGFPVERMEKESELTATEFHLEATKLIPNPISRHTKQ
jgi:hypothetical protein